MGMETTLNKRIYALPLSFLLLLLYMIVSACGSSFTNVSAGLLTTSLASVTDTNIHSSSSKGNYAFVRNEQLWLSLKGANPVQVTHFTYPTNNGFTNVFWNQPLWFANGRYVAFEVKAIPDGVGGGGCGYIGDDARNAGLFVIDTTTLKITQISVSGEKGPGSSVDGYWEYQFPENATQLLIWHSTLYNKNGGLYRYNVVTKALTLVLPASKVPNADSNTEAFSPMRYSNGQLYYEVMNYVPGSSALYDHVIYSHSITHPNEQTLKVFDAGTQVFCDVAHGNAGQYRETGWDVSSDGQHLVVQRIVKNKQGKETSIIQSVSLRSGTLITLFQSLAANVLSHDLVVSWAPDNRTVLLQSPSQTPGQGTFYSTVFTNPSAVQTYPYTTNFGFHMGHIFWKPNSTTFAFYAFQEYDKVVTSSVYTFTIGNARGSVLLHNATNFAWS